MEKKSPKVFDLEKELNTEFEQELNATLEVLRKQHTQTRTESRTSSFSSSDEFNQKSNKVETFHKIAKEQLQNPTFKTLSENQGFIIKKNKSPRKEKINSPSPIPIPNLQSISSLLVKKKSTPNAPFEAKNSINSISSIASITSTNLRSEKGMGSMNSLHTSLNPISPLPHYYNNYQKYKRHTSSNSVKHSTQNPYQNQNQNQIQTISNFKKTAPLFTSLSQTGSSPSKQPELNFVQIRPNSKHSVGRFSKGEIARKQQKSVPDTKRHADSACSFQPSLNEQIYQKNQVILNGTKSGLFRFKKPSNSKRRNGVDPLKSPNTFQNYHELGKELKRISYELKKLPFMKEEAREKSAISTKETTFYTQDTKSNSNTARKHSIQTPSPLKKAQNRESHNKELSLRSVDRIMRMTETRTLSPHKTPKPANKAKPNKTRIGRNEDLLARENRTKEEKEVHTRRESRNQRLGLNKTETMHNKITEKDLELLLLEELPHALRRTPSLVKRHHADYHQNHAGIMGEGRNGNVDSPASSSHPESSPLPSRAKLPLFSKPPAIPNNNIKLSRLKSQLFQLQHQITTQQQSSPLNNRISSNSPTLLTDKL